MNVKYLKNPDTKEKFYPITQSDCIIDSFSINDLEIDRLFQNSLSVSKHQRGMSYLNLQGLIHYHSKIKDCINEIKDSITDIPEVQMYTAGENITIENNVISAVVPEVDLSGYATEAYVDQEIANIDIPSLDGYATEQWVDDIYQKKLYVDLGLPSGLLWATMNVGATKPEEYGDYFAWGETSTKSIYKSSTYKWCNGTETTLTKYNTSSSTGTVDNKTQLAFSDDAAFKNWGGSWRMPTDAEWTELREQCTWIWTTESGVYGYKVISKTNSNSIFLSAAGYYYDSSLFSANDGYYWSSSLSTDYPGYAWNVNFNSSNVYRSSNYRYCGQSVRPVCEPTPNLNNTKTKEEVVNSTDGVYYFTTDTKEIYRNGIKYGYQVIYTTEEELLSKIKTSTLMSGYEYCIKGFVSNIDTSLGLSNIGHKIDLHIRATSQNTVDSSAWASYNTDGSDSFFYDNGIDVYKWDIKISINNNHLGIVNSASINKINPTSLYNSRIVGVAHNGIDTLVVAYNCNFVNVSTDGGNTFSVVQLPDEQTTVVNVLYGLGYFVVFDEQGHMSKSQDGFIWEQVSSFSITECTTACFSEDTFYITRSYYLYKTQDFVTWTSMYHGISSNGGWGHMGLAAGDGKIVVTTGGSGSQFGVYDGSSWHKTYPFASYWNGVGFGNHTFAIVCGNARSAVIYNTDQTIDLTWPDGTNKYDSDGLNKDPGKVCYHDGIFYSFAVPYRSEFYSYSTDGLNWTPIYLPKRAYIGTYGQTAPAFGPKGEMYIAECESNRVWVNFTPLDGNTWQVLHSPGIDIYKTIVENTEVSILCPYDPLSYYLTNDHINYTYYRFPNDYESPGVVVSGNKFCTLLYDRPNSLTYYATSIDGIDWELESIGNTSYCTNLTVNTQQDVIFGIFEDGTTCSIINDNVTFSDPGPTYINTKVIYDLNTESFLYSGAASESYGTLTPTTTIQKVKPLKDGTFDVNQINLTTERVVSCLDTRADQLYVFSGKNFEVINLLTGNTITGTLSYNVNNSCNFYSKLIIFGSNKSSLMYGTEAIDLQPEVDCVLPITDDLFLLSNTSEAVLYLGYVNFLTGIQVIELTDEFNNTCYFDFKNIIRDGSEQSKYFFDRFGEDQSLTGKIINFKQLDNNQLLLKLMQLKSVNYLQDCSVLQSTVGDVTTSNIMKCVSIKDVSHCNLSSLDLSNSKDKELWESNGTIYLKEACGDILYYTQNKGITWNVKNSNVSLEGYATEEFVTSQGYLTEVPENVITEETLSQKNYTTQTQVEDYVNESLSDYITVDDLSDYGFLQEVPSEYVTDGELEEMGYATEAWVQGKGYLTEHQDISNLATKDEIPSLDEYIKSEDVGSIDIKTLADSENLKQSWSNKQDKIEDLDIIRTGSNLGNTALQETSEVIRNLETQIQDVSKMKDSIGFNNNITVSFSGTNNLDECTTLIEAILKLDSLLINQTT